MNFQVRPETRDHIREIARLTYRGIGDTLDWLVAEAWKKMQSDQVEPIADLQKVGE
jgi:hypothetical protein